MATWFTSDAHFGHKNIMKFCPRSRPYANVDEMNEAMIKIWNSRVQPEDTIWHLGDLTFFHKFDDIANVLRRLNGKIRHIMGNHDEIVIKNRDRFISEGLLYSIQDYNEETYNGQKVVMFHFPQSVWNKNHHGSFCLYGHCHGSFKAVGKQMDVGWDTRDLRGTDHTPGPISWEQVKACLDARNIVVQDHHDGDRE